MTDISNSSAPSGSRIQHAKTYALTPLQEGMLYHNLSHGGTGVDVQQLVCTLHEELDTRLLERAWQVVTERHQALRTRFRWNDVSRPCQEFCDSVPVAIERHHWRGLTEAAFNDRLAAYCAEDRLREFDLTRPPLFRLASIRRGVDDYTVVWTFHHLIADGRSLPIVLNEVFGVYESLLSEEEYRLEPPACYSDFLLWLEGKDWSTAEGYWRSLLHGFSNCTRIAVDRKPHCESTSDSAASSTFARHQIECSDSLTSQLITLADSIDITVNTLVQGAWGLLLARYSGEDDVVFGATRACRHSSVPQATNTVGMFINTLPVRVQLDPTISVSEYLKAVRHQQVAVRDFEHTPLSKVREWSSVPGNVPLFESLVVFENYDLQGTLQAQGGNWGNRQFRSLRQTGFPLTVAACLSQRLRLCINYDQKRFDGPVVARMIEHLRTLLEGMIEQSHGRLQDIPMLTAEERHRHLVEWNDSSREYPRDLPLQSLFEQQVDKTPHAVALVTQELHVTYRELNSRAEAVAATLQRLGVVPEQPVGLWGERSIESIVALLGILKAGAAYVPLPVDAPSDRLKKITADAGIRHVVSGNCPDWLRENAALKWVSTTEVSGDDQSVINQAFKPAGDAIACIIYTSGTTGTPKGACVTHRGLVNLMMHRTKTQFRAGDFEFAPLTAPLHFDGSIVQLFSPLMTGGTLVIAGTMRELVESSWYDRLTVLTGASSLVAQLVLGAGIPKSAKVIGVGAEPVPGELLDRIVHGPRVERLVTGYGLTECSCYSTNTVIWERTPNSHSQVSSDDRMKLNSIGRPIANTQMYVLDQHGHLAPIGVPGALYVGGDGVGRGYWNRPDLTAERFVIRSVTADQRLFLTGDRACWMEDGQLEFLGRIDHQIKLRGYRIEPQEIEVVLQQNEHVQQAIVLLREDRVGDPRLVAYVVLRTNQNSDLIAELHSDLKSKLPEYMVPSAIVTIDAIPLTVNGKVDRKALPAPDLSLSGFERACISPRTPVEDLIAGIWRSVLGLDQIGIHDNFFELGGHSLRATQVISKVRDVFGVNLPIRSLFEAPTVAGLAAIVEQMSPQSPSDSTPLIAKVSRETILPLSFSQERLWFYDQFEPLSSVYNIPRVLRISGPLNTPALQQSLRTIVQRHESLRTNFVSVEGRPHMVLSDSPKFEVTTTDLRSQSSDRARRRLEELIDQEVARPFDLSQDLMLRAHLWCLNEHEHVLAITMHHIAADGWSLSIFDRELSNLYAADLAARSALLPELPIQYADFAAWQRQSLQGAELDRQLAYWKHQLSGASGMLELPTDLPRPATQSYRGSSQPIALSSELSQGLDALSRDEGVTSFMTLLAAFQLLLSRYSGQDNVSVGAPIAGRSPTEVEGLIGFFVNTLVLRTNLSGNPSFRELLRRVREVTLGAYAHQDLPFEKLVQELRPERSLSHSPLFQVMFVLQNVPEVSLELQSLSVTRMELDTGTTKFDLTLTLHPSTSGWKGSLQYNRDLFEPATIERFSRQLAVLLEGIVADPDLSINERSLLTDAEQQQIVVDWNRTQTDYPRDKCIHELFDDQVALQPDAIALICGEKKLSYGELNERANRVASNLRERGVRPDVLVELHAERSIEMIVGMLGILKAGGAYVPLDPSYPAERLAYLRNDLQTQFILKNGELEYEPAIGYTDNPNSKQESLDDDAARHHNQPRLPDSADQLAYVMYTSGSTGEPKGVCVTHRGVTRLVKNTSYIQPISSDRFLQYASPSFDASTFEIWGCLLNGGQLILPAPGALSLDELGRLMRQHEITVLWLTAGLFHLMVDRRLDDLRSVRTLLAGGDVLSPSHVRRALEAIAGMTLINGYGPTENTTFSTCHIMSAADGIKNTVPIGRPISNSQVYILDCLMQPVPIGVPGELYVGGDGLARGYHRRPEQTAEAFLANPFGAPGSRMYKTGDRGRFHADGTIEFLGRQDHQIKVRGHRVELEEVEMALGRHPRVRQSVVIAQAEDDGDKRLIAYVVPTDMTTTSDELRRHLSDALPAFMVPSHFIMLDTLPLTPHGKVDRRALPLPESRDFESRDSGSDQVAPHDSLEIRLTRIWEDVLKIRPLDVNDSFFDLGGHSLLAVKLFDRVAEAFGQSLPLATLFECPTISHLARSLRQRDWKPSWKSLVPVQPGGCKPPLFILPPASGTVIRFAELAKHLGPDQPVYGLEPLGHDDGDAPLESIEDMASLYLKEIRELQPTGPYLLAGICFGAYVAWEMSRQLAEQGCDVALVALLDPNPPAHGPTWVRKPNKPYFQRIIEDCKNVGVMRVAMKSVRRRLNPTRYLKSARRRWDRLLSSLHPKGRRHTRMLDAHIQAQKAYKAYPYSGPVVLVQSESTSLKPICRERWGNIAQGKFEQVVVPGTTHEDLLLGGRYTLPLAQILRERLDSAVQATNPVPPLVEAVAA